MTKLTIIRGLPGSGKSTMAKAIVNDTGACHFETDMFFIKDGVYTFNPSLIKDAHRWCQDSVLESLSFGLDTVVSNTFTQRWEYQPYLDMASKLGCEVDILVAVGEYENIHGVPAEAIQRMTDRWEV